MQTTGQIDPQAVANGPTDGTWTRCEEWREREGAPNKATSQDDSGLESPRLDGGGRFGMVRAKRWYRVMSGIHFKAES